MKFFYKTIDYYSEDNMQKREAICDCFDSTFGVGIINIGVHILSLSNTSFLYQICGCVVSALGFVPIAGSYINCKSRQLKK